MATKSPRTRKTNVKKTLSDVPVEEETAKPVVKVPVDHKKVPLSERVLDPKIPPFKVSRGIVAVLLIVALVVAGVGIVITLHSQDSVQEAKSTAPQADQRELAKLVERVGEHILLPQGEQATIATVSDVTKLRDQQFFAQADNGDKVLIYSKAKKAILYRPSLDKVIEVGPVIDGTPQAKVAGAKTTISPSPTPVAVTVALYNGTTTSGLTLKGEEDLESIISIKADVVARENAARSNYEQSVIIDTTGKYPDIAKELAQAYKGKVSPLPQGEATPSADLLIILGSSYQP